MNWYLLALKTAATHIETFALSRCRYFAGTGQHFARPAGFDAPAFFKDAFGISQADKLCDDAVALAEGVVEAGQSVAARRS